MYLQNYLAKTLGHKLPNPANTTNTAQNGT